MISQATDADWLRAVGPGWGGLVQAMLHHVRNANPKKEPALAITDVKEKYGTLRIYFIGGSDLTEVYVDALEDASAYICENCGRPGRNRMRRGWYKTDCDACFEARK